MAKFIIRRFFLLLLTMILVSAAVFLITEASPGNVARNVLGAYITPEQEASFLAQLGLDKPIYVKYFYWLIGSDWWASHQIGATLKRIRVKEDFEEWWVEDKTGALLRWKLEGDDLVVIKKDAAGMVTKSIDNERWKTNAQGVDTFWGVDTENHAVRWERGSGKKSWTFVQGVWVESTGAPVEYIPLKKGLIRGDPGISLQTGRPVANSLFLRFRNSLVLAAMAFIVVMPLALI